MKRIITLLYAAALALHVSGGVVKFLPSDFAGQGVSSTGGEVSSTKNGVTFATDKGYGATSALRCYKGGTITVSSDVEIIAIDLAFETSNGTEYTGGLESYIGGIYATTWTWSLPSQARLTEIKVDISAEVEEEKTDTLSVSEAIRLLNTGWSGPCYIHGRVAHLDESGIENYGNISYWLMDSDNASDSVWCYRMRGTDNKSYTLSAGPEFDEGYEILAYTSVFQLYHDNATNRDVPEMYLGYFSSLLSGKPVSWLDWYSATATRQSGGWNLDITYSRSYGSGMVSMSWQSDAQYSISGRHEYQRGWQVNVTGDPISLIAGYNQLTYAGRDESQRILYDVQMKVESADCVFRVLGKYAIQGVDESGNNISLVFDAMSEPVDGDTLSCIDAHDYGMTFAVDSVSPITVTVKGYLTNWVTGDGMSFWMDDTTGTAHTFEAYHCTMPDGMTAVSGSLVAVTGNLSRFNNQIEIKEGRVDILTGAQAVETYQKTVSETVEDGIAMGAGHITMNMYEVTGYVSGIEETYKPQYGNISFWMSDRRDTVRALQVYRAPCDAETAAKIKLGTKVRVTGRMQNYAKKTDGESTVSIIEIVNAKIEILAEPPVMTIFGVEVNIIDPNDENNLLDEVDINNDGTLVYNIEENVLVFNGAEMNVGATMSAAINYDCTDPLTIVLQGMSHVVADTVIASAGDIVIRGDGHINAEGMVPIIGTEEANIRFVEVSMHVRSLPSPAAVRERTKGVKFGRKVDENGGPALSGFGSADFDKVNITPSGASYGAVQTTDPASGTPVVIKALHRSNGQGQQEIVTEFELTPEGSENSALETVSERRGIDPGKPMYNLLGVPVDARYRGIVIQQGGVYWNEGMME